MELFVFIQNQNGYNPGDDTYLLDCQLSIAPSGQGENVTLAVPNPASQTVFKSSLKAAARAKALEIWGINVSNGNTLLIGE